MLSIQVWTLGTCNDFDISSLVQPYTKLHKHPWGPLGVGNHWVLLDECLRALPVAWSYLDKKHTKCSRTVRPLQDTE